ncbi:hypothetical protein ACN4EK_00200 [Pantanalinema rosaneae CENA516]|uniref:hypothetical protein n=1 Tax=Pantanalinema rosaneae TaxID=1620701 RepID=UPI003D6E1D14
MRPQDSTWQGCLGYWQNLFIRENLLPLGHAAWQGFITHGRGMVVCEMAIADAGAVDWQADLVEYTTHFIPMSHVSEYLQALNLDTGLITRLLQTIETYNPARDVLLLINEQGRPDINLLQNLAVSPVACYQQMQQRWTEFQLDHAI